MSPIAATAESKGANSSPKDYGYANARLRGMRARLMRRDMLERLTEAADLHQLIQDLMQTEYAPDLEEALIHGRGPNEVGEALRLNLVRTYRKVFGFLNAEAAQIAATVLGRWDVFNLKTILRGKHVHLSNTEISEGLLPVGALSHGDLEGLVKQPDIRAVVDTVSTWNLPQAVAMRDGFTQYARTGDLAEFELALDRYYAEWAAGRLVRGNKNHALARRILSIQVDIQNLLMIFRIARANLEPTEVDRYFLVGGSEVPLDLYQKLAGMSDVDEILDSMRGTKYGDLLEQAAERFLESQSISVFERALEDYLTRKAIALGSTDPLGVGIPIAYLWSKNNEVTNVRIIARGIAMGMPTNRMRRELILV